MRLQYSVGLLSLLALAGAAGSASATSLDHTFERAFSTNSAILLAQQSTLDAHNSFRDDDLTDEAQLARPGNENTPQPAPLETPAAAPPLQAPVDTQAVPAQPVTSVSTSVPASDTVIMPSPADLPTPANVVKALHGLDLADRTDIRQRTLSNGLHVVVVEDHAAPVVQTAVWYRFGALDEHRGKTGLAHGLEHMMFRGTPSLSEGGFDDIMAHEGAETNANTANDYTHFFMVLPESRLNLGLRIEADRMRHLLLREADWDLEKGAVLNEYDGDLGVPTTALYNDVCLRATPIPLCGLGALGVRSDIVNSTVRDLRAYYDNYYYPNNATLVIVGDVRSQDAFAAAEKAFGKIPAHLTHRRPHGAVNLAHNQRLIEHGDTPYATIDLAYPSVGDLDSQAGDAAIVDGVLSNPRGPLYASLILSGVALGYESAQNSNLVGGIQHVFITVAPGHTATEVEHIFRNAVATWLKNGISDSLIAAAKRAAVVNAVSSHDAIDTLGDRVGYSLGIEERSPSVDDALVAQATPEQINAFARATLSAPSVVGTLLPLRPQPGAVSNAGGSVSDNFTGRAPTGPIIEAPWVKSLVAQPLRISSRIAPVRFTLENGLRVIVQPVRGNATVFIDGQVEGSPLLEPADKDGLREMTSDLLGYGGQKYDFTALHELSDRLGAALSFGESFSAHGLASDFPTLLDVLADGQLHPTFPSNFVALVRKQTLAQIDARDRDPDSLAARKLSLGLLPAGDPDLRQATRASVARIKNSDFAEYLRRAYRPDLTVISVVGDVDPQVVRDEIVRTFGAWHATGTKPSLFLAAVPLPKPVQSHVLASRRLVEVSLAQPAISRSAPDFVAFNLLNEMLGGGGTFDTRLMRELRERRGLVYSASSGLEVGKYRGVLAINLSTPPEHAAQAIALVKAALIEFTKHAPSQSELDRARERLVAGSLVGEQSTAVIAAHVAQIGFYNLPNDYYKNLWQRYNRITPADILNVARRRLQPNHLVVVTEGPGR